MNAPKVLLELDPAGEQSLQRDLHMNELRNDSDVLKEAKAIVDDIEDSTPGASWGEA